MTQAALKKTFYSNGKLFLIGEYTVIDGSEAFAVPTVYGQYLDIEYRAGNTIDWKSLDADGSVWFKAKIAFEAIQQNIKTGDKITDTLIDILHIADKLNPNLLSEASGFSAISKLTFSKNWGLGSSSTLINNIAQWFAIDAYELLQKSFGGSGYDIACAQYNSAIIYQVKDGNPTVKTIDFKPDFIDRMYFIYLNKKQNTRSSVAAYKENAKDIPHLNQRVNAIIERAVKTESFDEFCAMLNEHSALLSQPLQMPTIKQELFPDFNGTLKSLGAWGGDFILAAAEEDPSGYFKSKGYDTVIPYKEMIIQ